MTIKESEPWPRSRGSGGVCGGSQGRWVAAYLLADFWPRMIYSLPYLPRTSQTSHADKSKPPLPVSHIQTFSLQVSVTSQAVLSAHRILLRSNQDQPTGRRW